MSSSLSLKSNGNNLETLRFVTRVKEHSSFFNIQKKFTGTYATLSSMNIS